VSLISHISHLLTSHLVTSVLTPGLVAAGVTVFFGWIQRPRPYLQMVRVDRTVDVAKWLALAEKDRDEKTAWLAEDFVLVTNYGDGAAYDIKLSGSNCRPRVRVRDTGRQEVEDGPVVPSVPIWSNRLGALQPGGEMSVVVMRSPDPSLPSPLLEVSWPRPLRWLGRRKRRLDLATAPIMESGWPGKTDIPAG
jgi:hypothetical protein